MCDFLKKDIKLSWSAPQRESFSTFKKLLISGPVLGHFSPGTEVKIHSNAIGCGIGGNPVLVEIQDGRDRPIAYASRPFTAAGRH